MAQRAQAPLKGMEPLPQDTSLIWRRQTVRQSVAAPAISYALADLGGPAKETNFGRVGWLSKITLAIRATLVTNATAAGHFVTYPELPFGFAQYVRVHTNTQSDLVAASGLMLARWQVSRRRTTYPNYVGTYDPVFGNVNQLYAKTGTAGTGLPTPGSGIGTAIAASTTYYLSGFLEIPIATDDALFLGAQYLQSDRITMTIQITPPAISQVINFTAGGFSSVAVTIIPQAEFFSQPDPKLIITPNHDFVRYLREQKYLVSSTGNVQYPLPIGNTYLSILGHLENNGLPAFYTNPSGPPTNLPPWASVGLNYAQTQNPIVEDYQVHLAYLEKMYGILLPDSGFMFDMRLGAGIPGFYEGRDFINSAQTSDLQLNGVIQPLAITAPASVYVLTEQLQRLGQ